MSAAEKPNAVVPPEAWIQDQPWLDRDDADIDAYVASLQKQPDYDLAQKLRFWRDNGIVVFENAVSHELIDAYLADIAALMQGARAFTAALEELTERSHADG